MFLNGFDVKKVTKTQVRKPKSILFYKKIKKLKKTFTLILGTKSAPKRMKLLDFFGFFQISKHESIPIFVKK